MQLVLFNNQRGATSISANDLDSNFARVKPLNSDGPQRQYAINETPQGWRLVLYPESILPNLPVNTGSDVYLLASSNGEYQWVRLSDILPLSPVASGQFVLTSQNGQLVWKPMADFFQDFFGPEWGPVAVQRCDGQSMYVWGTGWA